MAWAGQRPPCSVYIRPRTGPPSCHEIEQYLQREAIGYALENSYVHNPEVDTSHAQNVSIYALINSNHVPDGELVDQCPHGLSQLYNNNSRNTWSDYVDDDMQAGHAASYTREHHQQQSRPNYVRQNTSDSTIHTAPVHQRIPSVSQQQDHVIPAHSNYPHMQSHHRLQQAHQPQASNAVLGAARNATASQPCPSQDHQHTHQYTPSHAAGLPPKPATAAAQQSHLLSPPLSSRNQRSATQQTPGNTINLQSQQQQPQRSSQRPNMPSPPPPTFLASIQRTAVNQQPQNGMLHASQGRGLLMRNIVCDHDDNEEDLLLPDDDDICMIRDHSQTQHTRHNQQNTTIPLKSNAVPAAVSQQQQGQAGDKSSYEPLQSVTNTTLHPTMQHNDRRGVESHQHYKPPLHVPIPQQLAALSTGFNLLASKTKLGGWPSAATPTAAAGVIQPQPVQRKRQTATGRKRKLDGDDRDLQADQGPMRTAGSDAHGVINTKHTQEDGSKPKKQVAVVQQGIPSSTTHKQGRVPTSAGPSQPTPGGGPTQRTLIMGADGRMTIGGPATTDQTTIDEDDENKAVIFSADDDGAKKARKKGQPADAKDQGDMFEDVAGGDTSGKVRKSGRKTDAQKWQEELSMVSETLNAQGHAGLVVDTGTSSGHQQLQAALQCCQAVSIGFIQRICMSHGQYRCCQYLPCTQPGMNKAQRDKLRRGKTLIEKLKTSIRNKDGEVVESTTTVGLGVVCITCDSGTTQTTRQHSPGPPPMFYVDLSNASTLQSQVPGKIAAAAPQASRAVQSIVDVLCKKQTRRGVQPQLTTGATNNQQYTPSSPAQASVATPVVICADSKGLIRELLVHGVHLPAPVHTLDVVDPCVLSWLYEPHLVHKDEEYGPGNKALDTYNLQDLAQHHKLMEGSTTTTTTTTTSNSSTISTLQVIPAGYASRLAAAGNATGPGWSGGASGSNNNIRTNNKNHVSGGSGSNGPAASGGLAGRAAVADLVATLPPCLRLRAGLLLSCVLVEKLVPSLQTWLPPRAVALEMKVSLLLGAMEARGVALSHDMLSRHTRRVSARLASLKSQAARLAGREDFNPGSAQQLADVLYNKLRLPVPESRAGGNAAKTHASTDEAALKALSSRHSLPQIILDYRCMTNLMSKWLQPPWAQQAIKQAGQSGGNHPRVHCSWNCLNTATGRLSSSSPNLQAVTKYTVEASTGSRAAGRSSGTCMVPATTDTGKQGSAQHAQHVSGDDADTVINVRDAFVAAPGCVLISADYSQIELRVLAHMCGDQKLTALLRQAGANGDVFRLIAASWLKKRGSAGNTQRPGLPMTPSNAMFQGADRQLQQKQQQQQQVSVSVSDVDVAGVTKEEREQAKRIVYGIIYGLTAYGLHQQLSAVDSSVDLARAQQLINSFLHHFSGVKAFVDMCNRRAAQLGHVVTMGGRRRPLPGLTSADRRVQSDYQRRVVNSIVQGSAADIIKQAMLHWEDWAAQDNASTQQAGCDQSRVNSTKIPTATSTVSTGQTSEERTSQGTEEANSNSCEGWRARLVAQIHDELLIECRDDPGLISHVTRVLRSIMAGVVQLSVPLIVNIDVGYSWGTMTRVND